MKVFYSRFTPNLSNGERVKFNIGDKVLYRLSNGTEVEIIIDSEYRRHISGELGYEAIFTDDGKRYFSVSSGIIGWNGKATE